MEIPNQPNKKRVAIITGATKGIGKGIAIEFSKQGIAVVITSRDILRAQELVEEIVSEGGDAFAIAFNIENASHLDALIEQTVAHYGRLDILVNNAISQRCLLPSVDFVDQDIIQLLTYNITHNYLLCRKAYPHLRANAGCILNIGSVVAEKHMLGLQLYSLVKGAINQMTQVLASEWAQDNVRVNALNPGFVRTEAFHDLGVDAETIEQAYRFYGDYQPLSGVGIPKDVANAALFLTGTGASSITGALLNVDGGFKSRALNLYGMPE